MSKLHKKPEEIWKDVPAHLGRYQVSNYGRVKSFVYEKEGKILRYSDNSSGYKQVVLKGHRMLVHRLVAMMFLEMPENKTIVNHLDSNPSNNCVWNLEWCNQHENQLHANRYGNTAKRIGSGNHLAKIDELKALAVVHLFQKFNAKEISRILGIGVHHVYKITSGKTWSHITGKQKIYYYKESCN